MRKNVLTISRMLVGLAMLAFSKMGVLAQSPCTRYPARSMVSEPEDLYSENGVLSVDFTYHTSTDATGKTYYCFVNSDGVESPTLHVRPGDVLKLSLTNLVPEQPGKGAGMPAMEMAKAGEGGCGAANMTASSVNIHFPKAFQMDDPPSIVTTQGSVEDWTIENRAQENHEFHMHQIHFLTLARNGKTLPKKEQQYLDTVDIPYWSGTGPYPNVTLRMDFRGPDVGDFVYHCHILDHEDAGMMAIIRVLPAATGSSAKKSESTEARKVAGRWRN